MSEKTLFDGTEFELPDETMPDECSAIVLDDDSQYRTFIAVVGNDIIVDHQYYSEMYDSWLSTSDTLLSIAEVDAAYKLLHPDAE